MISISGSIINLLKFTNNTSEILLYRMNNNNINSESTRTAIMGQIMIMRRPFHCCLNLKNDYDIIIKK